jgi:hypothetical protein
VKRPLTAIWKRPRYSSFIGESGEDAAFSNGGWRDIERSLCFLKLLLSSVAECERGLGLFGQTLKDIRSPGEDLSAEEQSDPSPQEPDGNQQGDPETHTEESVTEPGCCLGNANGGCRMAECVAPDPEGQRMPVATGEEAESRDGSVQVHFGGGSCEGVTRTEPAPKSEPRPFWGRAVVENIEMRQRPGLVLAPLRVNRHFETFAAAKGILDSSPKWIRIRYLAELDIRTLELRYWIEPKFSEFDV